MHISEVHRGQISARMARVCAALALTLLASGGPARAADEAKSGGWLFEADAHVWTPAVGIKTAAGDKVHLSMTDILRNLDFAFMGGFGARKDRFSFGVDVLNLKLAADGGGQFNVPVGPANPGSVPVSVGAKSVMKGWIVNAVAGYRLIENDDSWLDGVAGMRYLWLDVTNTLDVSLLRLSRSIQISGSDGNIDGIVGVRGEVKVNPGNNYYFAYYGDVGTGESDLTWATQARVGYRFDQWDVYAGYRYMYWNFDGGAAFDNLRIYGPVIGGRYRF